LYLGLLAALLLLDRAPLRALGLFALASLLPALWFWQCWRATGDGLAPLRHIDADHRALAVALIRWLGPIKYRLYCLGYWPAAVLIVCTPLAGLFAIAGAWRALGGAARAGFARRPLSDEQVLAALAWLPAAYFTFRGAVLAEFRPMARFAMAASALS